MLFCCLRRNVEASCHKHFVVVSRHQQSPPLYYQRLVSSTRHVRCSYCTWRSERSQHAMEPDIGSESRFLPTPPAFDVTVRGEGSRRNITMPFSVEKLEWCGYPTVKKNWRCVYSFWQNSRTWRTHTVRQTDRQSPHDSIGIASLGETIAYTIHDQLYMIVDLRGFYRVFFVNFYRAMLCERGLCRHAVSVCPSVRLSVRHVRELCPNE